MTDEERKAAAEALARIKDPSGHLGTELFDQIARFSTSIAFEAVLMRPGQDGGEEVYLTQRDTNDTAYPGAWHCPGSILRRGEQPADVAKRLAKKEYLVPIVDFKKVDEFFYQESRGWFCSFIYLIQTEREPEAGAWFSVDDLPDQVVPHHRDVIIPRAAAALKKG